MDTVEGNEDYNLAPTGTLQFSLTGSGLAGSTLVRIITYNRGQLRYNLFRNMKFCKVRYQELPHANAHSTC